MANMVTIASDELVRIAMAERKRGFMLGLVVGAVGITWLNHYRIVRSKP